MATIESYVVADGKRYMVRYRAPNGKQTKKRGFSTKRAAEAFAATVEVDKMTGAYVAPSLGLVTIGELGPVWLEKKQALVSSSWSHTLEIAWRVHVEPHWGATKISDIDPLQVETWVAELSRGKSAPVIRTSRSLSFSGCAGSSTVRAGVTVDMSDSLNQFGIRVSSRFAAGDAGPDSFSGLGGGFPLLLPDAVYVLLAQKPDAASTTYGD